MNDFILPLHLTILAFVAVHVIIADHKGYSWIKGEKGVLDKSDVKKYHRRISIGLGLMIVTGFLMFYPMREYLLTRLQFYVKMGFVLALVVNSFMIGSLQSIATSKTFASLSKKEKIPLFISGAISTLCWIGAALGGFYLIPD